MAKSGEDVSNKKRLRKTIKDMICNIETVMSNIHVVMGDIGVLVQQIDTITNRLENKHRLKLKKPEIRLDANSNECDVIETPGVSIHSKLTLPSPYMDYTYLDLTNECDACLGNIQSFSYNEKYPLWIQYDTWRTGNTTSDMSEVSSGSDVTRTVQSGNSTFDKSWMNISNFGDKNANHKCSLDNRHKSESRTSEQAYLQLSKCYSPGNDNDSGDKYCGVYELIMEQQLEDVGPGWGGEEYCDDVEDSFGDDLSGNSAGSTHGTVSISDEHVIHYNKRKETWTAYNLADVTVREFSDTNSNSSL